MTAVPKNSIWAHMSYMPPRGPCNHKSSLISAGCPCLRFMLHPVKASTSFECDGCGHHASFHSLENAKEDAILNKWAQQEQETRDAQPGAGTGKKRKRITEKAANGSSTLIELLDDVPEDGANDVLTGDGSSKLRASSNGLTVKAKNIARRNGRGTERE